MRNSTKEHLYYQHSPYYVGTLMTRYLKTYCQLCQSNPSQIIASRSGCNKYIVSNHLTKKTFNNQDLSYKRSLLTQLIRLLTIQDTGVICQACHNDIVWLPAPMSIELMVTLPTTRVLTIQSISYYQPPVNKIIVNYKFSEQLSMLPLLQYMIQQLPKPEGYHSGNSVIIAMPTTKDRMIERGFNPLYVLTQYLSQHWNIPVWKGVRRIDNTVSQRNLNRNERFDNIKGAFSLVENLLVDKVILFDDVATTGASLQELASILLLNNKNMQLRAYCIAHGNNVS